MLFLAYLLKVNIAVILFYGFYRLLFQQDTLFRWKRAALIAILFISVLYPFVDMTRQFVHNYHLQEAIESGVLPLYVLPEITVFGRTTGQSVSFVHYLPQLLSVLYGAGMLILLVRLLIQTGIIIRIVNGSQRMELFGQTIYRHPNIKMPFSFFRWIVLNPESYTDTELREILRHETTHVRQAHSIDILLAEFLCAFCWFNPFVWLLKREIRMNLEFLADRSVLASGYEAEHYQFHLLRLTYHKAAAKIVNNFNVSLLKKRIFMMNKKQTSKLSICKYTLLIPVVGALVFFNGTLQIQAGTGKSAEAVMIQETVVVPETIETVETTAMTVQDTVTVLPTKGKIKKVVTPASPKVQFTPEVYSHVEKMPQFPGGDQALMQWLFDNIQYPASAQEQAIQGRVIVRFVIASDGSVEDATILRSLDPACDQEALRVISIMPKWIPGTQNGKAVAVYYTLPIIFKLEGKDAESKKDLSGKDAQLIKATLTPSPGATSGIPDDVVIEVDGKIITSSELSSIAPSDIQSIEVIKDEKPNKIKITLKK